VLRPDLVLVGIDQLVEGGRIDQPLVDQQGLERLDAQRELGRRLGMAMTVVLMMFAHTKLLRSERPRRDPIRRSGARLPKGA
jgi:hypothetical protein